MSLDSRLASFTNRVSSTVSSLYLASSDSGSVVVVVRLMARLCSATWARLMFSPSIIRRRVRNWGLVELMVLDGGVGVVVVDDG